MARNDFTPLPAPFLAESQGSTLDTASSSGLTLIQLEAVRSIMNRRVMSAVAHLSDRVTKLAAIVVVYRRLRADLLAKFAVPDVVDIPVEQFVAACEFLEAVSVARTVEVGAEA